MQVISIVSYRAVCVGNVVVVMLACALNVTDESAKWSAVVDVVAELCESRERFMQQLTDILHVDEPDRYDDYDTQH